MQRYSHVFETIAEPSTPVGDFTVLRYAQRDPLRFHDFAIEWDEDHDKRVVWIAEQLWVSDLLQHVLFIGERKASLSVVLRSSCNDFAARIENLLEIPDGDCWNLLRCSPLYAREQYDDGRDGARAAVSTLWSLGFKPVTYSMQKRSDLLRQLVSKSASAAGE